MSAPAVPAIPIVPALSASWDSQLGSMGGVLNGPESLPPERADCPPAVDERSHCVELLLRSPTHEHAVALVGRLKRAGYDFDANEDRVTGYLDAKTIERLFGAPPSYSMNMASATNHWICELTINGNLPEDFARDVERAMADDPVCEL